MASLKYLIGTDYGQDKAKFSFAYKHALPLLTSVSESYSATGCSGPIGSLPLGGCWPLILYLVLQWTLGRDGGGAAAATQTQQQDMQVAPILRVHQEVEEEVATHPSQLNAVGCGSHHLQS